MTASAAPDVLTATLPHPVGINRTYRSGGRRWYKTPAAEQWAHDAVLLLRQAGFRTLRPGEYAIELDLALYTQRQDLDAGIKATLDAVSTALGVDDCHVRLLVAKKVPAQSRQEQRLEVRMVVRPAAGTDGGMVQR